MGTTRTNDIAQKITNLTIRKRSVTINGHATSVSMEQTFWDHLNIIATRENKSLNQLITNIDAARAGRGNLSSALRVFIVQDLAISVTTAQNPEY